MSGKDRLAVIVPTLNEEESLATTLQSLLGQTWPAERIVISDGGSSDGTIAVAEAYPVKVVRSGERGRGNQIAAALADVDEEIIVIAHADMIFPKDALAVVREGMKRRPESPGGCLGHRFDGRRFVYRLMEVWDFCRGWLGHSYGDQAQFFRRKPVLQNEGFPAQPLMEDVELARMLRKHGRPMYLHRPVVVSARRFRRKGWGTTIWVNWRIRQTYRRHGLQSCAAVYRRYFVE